MKELALYLLCKLGGKDGSSDDIKTAANAAGVSIDDAALEVRRCASRQAPFAIARVAAAATTLPPARPSVPPLPPRPAPLPPYLFAAPLAHHRSRCWPPSPLRPWYSVAANKP